MMFSMIFSAAMVFSSPGVNDTLSWEAKADTVLHYAFSQLGVTYKFATCAPGTSFDCSGFTYFAYEKIGVKVNRSSSGLAAMGYTVSLEQCRKGDMILFTGTRAGDTSVGHVGIITKNEDGKIEFIHASSSTAHYGVVVTDYYNSAYPKRFVCVKRVFE
jgi:cell wall-associated NlpC family hydrolase